MSFFITGIIANPSNYSFNYQIVKNIDLEVSLVSAQKNWVASDVHLAHLTCDYNSDSVYCAIHPS